MRKFCLLGLLLSIPAARADVPPPRPRVVACTETKTPPGEFCVKCMDGSRSCARTFMDDDLPWHYRCTDGGVEYWCLPWASKEPPKVPTPPPASASGQGYGGHRNGRSPPPPQAGAEAGLMGLVETHQREGDKLVLFIDKGAAAGVKVGTEGVVLEGKAGFEPLTEARLRVVRVIDDHHCVAEVTVRSLGRSRRVSLFVPK